MADYSIEVSVPNVGPQGPQGPAGEFGELEAPEDGIIYGRKDAEWVDMTSPANLQVRRGTAAEVAAITPLEGEPVWATDAKLLYVGDGTTTGGIQVGEFPLDGDAASGFTTGKIRAANSTNGTGSQFGTTKVLGNARGAGSVDLQMERTNAANVASGNYSFIGGGNNNKASGQNSVVVGGTSCQATESYAFAFGNFSVASGASSIALQGGTASASFSFAFGGTADRVGMFATRAPTVGNFSQRGQVVQFSLRGLTTNDTPTEMFVANNVRLTIPENVSLFGTIQICAMEPTNATESAHFVRKFAIQNLSGTTTLIGNVTTVGTDHESDAGYDVAITADDAGDFLKIEVTGDASKTLRWVAAIQGVEIGIA